MDVVLHFTDDDRLLQGRGACVVPDRSGRQVMWLYVRSGMSEHDIAREVSIAATRVLRAAFLCVGTIPLEPAA